MRLSHALLAVHLLAAVPVAGAQRLFPYELQKATLENGLDVIVIPMPEFKGVLSVNMLVLAGARNEIEKGRTGFAHLFEHIMFQHRYRGEESGYNAAIDKIGAHNNAWTWYDVTFYHPLTFTASLEPKGSMGGEPLPGILELEASRFTSLDFTEKIFKTETGAVLGEYRKNATDPSLAMAEKQLELLFPNHPYGHTTIGYRRDVEDMPNHYDYARWFYDTYYRPNNCILVITGDVTLDQLRPRIESAFGAWQSQPTPVITATDPPQTAELRGHVAWDAPVPPRISVAYKGPRYETGTKESAVMQILKELLASPSAPLYRQLRYEKKSVGYLRLAAYDAFDPYLIEMDSQLFAEPWTERGEAYLEETVRDMVAGFEDLRAFSSSSDAARVLEVIKSKFTYDLLGSLDSPANVALTFALLYRFERDPEVLDKLLASVQELTPSDIDAFAQRYFAPSNRVIVTMAPKEN